MIGVHSSICSSSSQRVRLGVTSSGGTGDVPRSAKLVDDALVLQRHRQCVRQLLDDLVGRVRGHVETVPDTHLDVGHTRLGRGREVG